MNLWHVFPCTIYLSNGSKVIASEQGSIQLSPNFVVQNVFFIPELRCNLISLGQLMDEINCFVTLADDLLIIQDCTLRMPIRVSKQKDRIFLYQPLQLSSMFPGSVRLSDLGSL